MRPARKRSLEQCSNPQGKQCQEPQTGFFFPASFNSVHLWDLLPEANGSHGRSFQIIVTSIPGPRWTESVSSIVNLSLMQHSDLVSIGKNGSGSKRKRDMPGVARFYLPWRVSRVGGRGDGQRPYIGSIEGVGSYIESTKRGRGMSAVLLIHIGALLTGCDSKK